METASRVVTEEARNVFPFGLVFDDQMFGLSIVFHLLNRGLWDQQLVDAPQEAPSRAIRYSAVMGE